MLMLLLFIVHFIGFWALWKNSNQIRRINSSLGIKAINIAIGCIWHFVVGSFFPLKGHIFKKRVTISLSEVNVRVQEVQYVSENKKNDVISFKCLHN